MNDRRKFCMATLALAASPVFAQQTAGNAGIVYVSDFELDDASVTADQNPVDNARRLAGGLLPRPLLRRDKTGTRASDIVEQLAQALVADLRRAGLDARRLPAGATPPAQGWLVRGVFLDVDEGNRLRRAIVGFGAGANEVDLAVAVDGLSKQTPAPLYQVVESRSSASKPGAGAAIALNPYVAAAKFVMARGDQRKTVDRAASEVSDAVLARVKSAP